MDIYGVCPNCNTSWDDGFILDKFIQKREEGSPFFKDLSDIDIFIYIKEHYSPPFRYSTLMSTTVYNSEGKETHQYYCPHCKAII